MKRAALIATLIVSLATGSAAMADGRGHDDHRHHAHGADHHFRGDRHSLRHDFRRGPSAHAHRAPARHGTYRRPHGYYPHRWVRGERLPVAYFARPYVIVDYRDCGLRKPPRGHHWVRVGSDAVLAAVATGIVLDTVFHLFD